MLMTKGVTILILFVTTSLSAPDPNGCFESCLTQRLMRLQSTSPSLDYSRPGNWTEHNQYIIDGGRGKVHEEHGQYVDESKQMRYFRKNYTSSYGSGTNTEHILRNVASDLNTDHISEIIAADQRRLMERNLQSQGHSQKAQSLVASHEAAIQEMNRLMEASHRSFAEQTSATSRLEDFSSSGKIMDQNQIIHTRPKTTGGNERGYEEHGQIQDGSTNVKFYKKNYTSNYSSMMPISTPLFDHSHQIDSFGRKSEVNSGHHMNHNSRSESLLSESSHVQANYGNHDTTYGINHGNRKGQELYQTDNSGISTGHVTASGISSVNEHANTYDSARRIYVPIINPHQNFKETYMPGTTRDQSNIDSLALVQGNVQVGTQSHRGDQAANSYQQQGQHSQSSSYQGYENSDRRVATEHGSLKEETSVYDSNLNQDQQRSYQSAIEAMPSGSRGHINKYEEHHSHSSHYKESTIPHYTLGTVLQKQQSLHHLSDNQYGSTHQNSGYATHNSYFNQGRNTYAGQLENNNDQAFGNPTNKLVIGMLDLNHDKHGPDCVGEKVSHAQYSSQYRRS